MHPSWSRRVQRRMLSSPGGTRPLTSKRELLLTLRREFSHGLTRAFVGLRAARPADGYLQNVAGNQRAALPHC